MDDSKPGTRRQECERIIHAASTAAAVVGGATVLPGADAVFIMPVQVGMVVALARAYEIPVTQSMARSVIYASFGQIIGRGSSRLLAGLVPGIGNLIRGGVAFGLTEAIGWSVVEQLEAGEFE